MVKKKIYSILFSVEVLIQLTHTLQCICTHILYFTHCEWSVNIHICACMCKHNHTHNLGWWEVKNVCFCFVVFCFFSWRSVLDGYLLRLFSLALAFCLSVWHPQLWQSRNTGISVQQESMGKLFAFQICSRVWRVMWHSASIEIRGSRRWEHTADMQGDEGETLTVRLSRSSCMIKVLSL